MLRRDHLLHVMSKNNIRKRAVDDIANNLRFIEKCHNKLECLVFYVFFNQYPEVKLNKQYNSVRARLFI